MTNSPPAENRAVVIGASIAGLAAARVLANHFPQVIIVERDSLPPPGQPRKGVPQGRHLHVLLAHGRELLEGYFPGLTDELAARGAIVGDLAETVRWYSAGTYTRNFRSGLLSLQASRPLLEGLIFQRVCALPNVTLLQNHDVTGLTSHAVGDGGQKHVTGVKVIDRSAHNPQEQDIPAVLVVDAAGRGSRSLSWLEEMGYPRPPEEHIKMGLSYTTIEFRRLPEHAGGSSTVVVMPSLENRRGGVLLAVEGDRWIGGLSGMLGQSAPLDLPGFIEYARGLDAPDVYEVIKNAEALTEARLYKYPASQRRYFEKLNRFPQGFLVLGDAVCSFNPIYGQGMTVAVSEAAALDDILRAGLDEASMRALSRRFFRAAGRLLDAPWSIAAGSDLAYPEVQGRRSRSMALAGLYLERFLMAAREDAALNLAFQRVTNLMDPPSSLFHPRHLLRVLRRPRKRPN